MNEPGSPASYFTSPSSAKNGPTVWNQEPTLMHTLLGTFPLALGAKRDVNLAFAFVAEETPKMKATNRTKR